MQFRILPSSRFIYILLTAILVNNSISAQSLSVKQQDSIYLSHPFKDQVRKINNSLTQSFKHFEGNEISLFGAINFNNQRINDKGITAPVNYMYDKVNNDIFKSGFAGGIRLDGIYMQKHRYALMFSINRINAGTAYQNKYSLKPFMEDFTHFKADNQFTTINLAAHYKKLLPINDMQLYKFYAVVGPSFDYKISSISKENLINGAGKRTFINGDIGAEFDNKGYYILYAHYKLGYSLMSSAAPVKMNRFEIGMSMRAKDLF